MAKVLAYQIKIDGIERTIRNSNELRDAIKDVSTALNNSNFGSDRYRRLNGELGKLKELQKGIRNDTREAGRQFTISADRGQKSYRALNAELVSLRRRYKDLGQAAREGLEGRSILKQIQSLDKELKKIDRSLGQNFRNVGNYQSAFGGLVGVLKGGLVAAGVATGIEAIGEAAVDSVRVFVDFQDQIAIVGAVSRATSEELQQLEADALRLAEATQFSASEIGQLQINLGRGGFRPTEIIEATESILNLAVATGEDLARASEVASSNIRAFGLAASESSRFTDVLTTTLNTSNNQLEDFSEAAKLIAPVSRVLNISFEETAAAIGILGDNGLKGSIATTTLATSLQQLAKENSSYRKAARDLNIEIFNQNGEFVGLSQLLKNVQEGTKDLTEEQRLSALSSIFGARATKNWTTLLDAQKTVLVDNEEVLASGGEALGLYTKQLEDAAGAAEEARKKIEDTLGGDLRKLNSTIEGVRISLVSNFESSLRAAVQFTTDLIKRFRDAFQFIIDAVRPVVGAISGFVSELFRGSDAGETFRRVLEFAASTILYLSNLFTTAFTRLTAFIRVIRETASESSVLSRAFNLINDAVQAAVFGISRLPAVLNGVLEAYKDLSSGVADGSFDFNLRESFNRGYEAAIDFTRKVKEEAAKQEEILKSQGTNLLQSFEQIKREAKGTEDVANRLRLLAEETGISFEKIADEYARFIKKNNRETEDSSKGAESAVDRLRQRQRELKEEIEEAAIAGEDYSDLLEEYTAITEQLDKATSVFRDNVADTPNVVEGSISFLQKEIQRLKGELEAESDQNAIRDKLQEIIAAEAQLTDAKNQVEQLREELEGVDEITVTGLVSSSLGFDPGSSEESLRQLEDLQQKQRETAEQSIEQLERSRLLQIKAARERITDEEEFAEARKLINSEVDRQILNERLALAEIGSTEYLRLQQELADKETEINEIKNEKILEQERETRQQLQEFALDSVEQVADTVLTISENRAQAEADREIEALQELYERRIELAEGDREEQERLREELAERTEILEAAAAREAQQRAVKRAIINTALAVGSALLTQPFIPAGLIAAAQAAAIGAAQVLTIRSQSFDQGGFTGSAPLGAKQDSSGHKPVGVVHENEYVAPAKVLRTKEGQYHVAKLEEIRRKMGYRAPGNYALYQEGGPTSDIVIPAATVAQNASFQVKTELQEEDIELIALAVREGTEVGSERGSAKAIRDSDRLAERKAFLEQKSSI